MSENRFAELRVKAGLKQTAAAEKIGVERSTISKWETGQAEPRGRLLRRIARAYKCSIDDLFKPNEREQKDNPISVSEPAQKTLQTGD